MGTAGSREPQWMPNGRRKVLVTGGAGLLGRPLMKYLVQRNMAVMSVSSKRWHAMHPHIQERFAKLGVANYTLDLFSDISHGGGGLRELIAQHGFDLVINLVADRGGVKYDGRRMRMDNEVLNTQLPERLALIAEELNVPVFLLSTEYVWTGLDTPECGYPPLPVGKDPQERFIKDAGMPYAVQKYRAEAVAEKCRVRLTDGGDSNTVIRIPLLYGELLGNLEDGTATASIDNFLTINDWKHDTWQKRYPTYADDAAYIIAALAQKRLDKGLRHSVYHYGSQVCMSKYEFMRVFAEEAGLNTMEVRDQCLGEKPAGKRPPFNVRLDISETEDELGECGQWREPHRLDGPMMRKIYFGVCAKAMEKKRLQDMRHTILKECCKGPSSRCAPCRVVRRPLPALVPY